jgi:leucyl-tRNA synthetase
MKIRFNPSEFEQHWSDTWDKEKTYLTHDPKPGEEKNYTLVMFPYPSGAGLHTGHSRVYTGTDVLARYYRMKGQAVLHPMGWDAFGLPAENAAIKEKKNPNELTKKNVANFKRQMKMLGISYDWDREINTTDPSYYAVTQWLFIEFYKHGLLYKKETPVYYCPFCKTGLAQEEVQGDGTHERCGKKVEKRSLPQWIFRITTYAEQLLEGLKGLDWPTGILEMQRNWIGKKEGLIITHKVEDLDIELKTFTAFPAWSFADTYIVIAPEHPQVLELVQGTEHEKEVMAFVKEFQAISEEDRLKNKFEKKGVFTGRYAIDPFSGNKMPIWLANFALMNFGTGIIRCSAHDERDYAFAQKYNIPVKEVVERVGEHPVNAHENKGVLKDSGKFSGEEINEGLIEEMHDWIVGEGFGERHVNYHLRDWIFSRQRYWGEPIPMVFCQDCADKGITFWDTEEGSKDNLRLTGAPRENNIEQLIDDVKPMMPGWFPLSKDALPLQLPEVDHYEPSESGESPLAQIPEWLHTTCPHCGGDARRETDTMPNWAGSCWYFLAFAGGADMSLEKIDGKPWNEKAIASWMPVDWYIGGAEHAVLHLLYARFWMHVLYDLNLIPFYEPFTRLRNVGMVLAEDHRKMSKSLGNVINPDDVVAEYGTDTLRVYEMFMAPFNQEVHWSTQSLQGSYRFLKRIWQIYNNPDKLTNDVQKSNEKIAVELQRLVIKITNDIPNVKFNTPISGMMELLNLWEAKDGILTIDQAKTLLKLLAPFAPFITEQIWHSVFKETTSIHLAQWPIVDDANIKETMMHLPVQVNGKVRGFIEISSDAAEDEILKTALQKEQISKWLEGKEPKHIYVPGRILNLVV